MVYWASPEEADHALLARLAYMSSQLAVMTGLLIQIQRDVMPSHDAPLSKETRFQGQRMGLAIRLGQQMAAVLEAEGTLPDLQEEENATPSEHGPRAAEPGGD